MSVDSFRIQEFLRNYGLVIFVWVTLISFLGYPEFSPSSSLLQTILLLAWAYFGHVLAHKISSAPPFDLLNPHVSIHHKHMSRIPRWLNLFQETLTNLASFLFILPLQSLLGIQVFSTSIVLASALLYVFVHIGDYSLRGNELHKQHHIQDNCNYAPDFMDALFETRCGNQAAAYVNHNHEILHGIAAVLVVYGLKKAFDLH